MKPVTLNSPRRPAAQSSSTPSPAVLHAGELRAYFQGSQTIGQGDVNGDGKADFSIALNGHINFDIPDFIL